MCFLLSCTGCNKRSRYADLKQAVYGYFEELKQAESIEEKEQILNKLSEYMLSDLQGNHYYRHDATAGSFEYERNKYPEKFSFEKDDRTIYVKNKQEIYIVPYSEQYMKENNIKISDLASIENAELYKYKMVSFEPSANESFYYGGDGISIILKSCYIEGKYGDVAKECYSTPKITYYPRTGFYGVDGYFADMISDADDIMQDKENLSNGFSDYRRYYKDLTEAEEICKEEADSVIQKEKEEYNQRQQEMQYDKVLSESIPQVGMTADEVRNAKWGNPNKINKDTYEWGTNEQWVYDNYGYVYFKNGIVSSVSER